MTVSSDQSSETFSCDGSTTVFTCPFRVLAASELRGFLITVSTGASSELTNGTDFTVSGVDAANCIATTATAYSSLYQLRFKRTTQRLQPTDYSAGDAFPAESHERALDRLTHIAQELDAGEIPNDAADVTLRLASDSSAEDGAGMVGHSPSISYPANTVGYRLNRTLYLSSYADPTGVTAADTGLALALSELRQYCELVVDGNFKLATGGTLTNKNNIAIVGNGRLFLSGAASNAMVLQMVGTCDDLRFEGITVVGQANAAYSQTGIGNFSGQTLSRIRYINVNAKDLNVGLSFLGNAGTCDKWYSAGCIITNTVGTVSGSGYGFHIDNATNGVCMGVEVDNASRHSIYHGRGSGNIINGPKITNHRSSVFDGTFKAAISISRSSNIQIIGGEVLDAYDGQLEIGADSISNAASVSDIHVIGLKLTNRKNSVYGVQIGEQIDPSTYTTSDIVLDLKITDNHVTVGAVPAIIVNNVNGLNMRGTRILRTGITGTTKLFAIGNAPYISSDADCQDTLLDGMEFIARGTTLTDVRAIDVDSDICGNTSRHKVGRNAYTNVTAPVYFNATLTNPNFLISQLYGEGAYNPASLVDGAGVTTTVAVAGLQLGDRVDATFSLDLQGILLTAWVSAAGTASVRFQNETGGTIDLGSGTIRVFGTRGDIQ